MCLKEVCDARATAFVLPRELINTRNGFHLWSETYERELQGVFALQDEITRSIVDALKIKLAVSLPAHEQRNTEAYDLYLQGLYFSNKGSEEDLRRALSFFQRARRERSDIFACLDWDREGLVFSGGRLRKTTRRLPSIKRSSVKGNRARRERMPRRIATLAKRNGSSTGTWPARMQS